MRRYLPIFLALVAGCHPVDQDAPNTDDEAAGDQASPPDTPLRPATPKPPAVVGEWTLLGDALSFVDAARGKPSLILSCMPGRLIVRMPGTTTVGSEERLTFGGGGEVETLVVDVGVNEVRAEGAPPPAGKFAALLEAGPGASYGATAVGPLVPVSEEVARDFVARCG